MDGWGFGPWQRCQLFVGSAAAQGARSILHFDQYDNLFVQLSGTKRFRIFDPQQTAALYPYPVHHPLDTRAQVDLEQPDLEVFPDLARARGTEIVLGPGQTLFLPATWWHEVVTEPVPDGQVTVSVNFWFASTARLLSPTLPLVPSMRVELARQLEYLVSDSMDDKARHVPKFLAGLLTGLACAESCAPDQAGEQGGDEARLAAAHAALDRTRPHDVDPGTWHGLFEFVAWKLAALVGATQAAPFARDLCSPARFEQLRLHGQ